MNRLWFSFCVAGVAFFALPLFTFAGQIDTLKIFKPVKTTIPEFGKAFCTKLPGGVEVCKAVVDPSDPSDAKFLVRRGGTILGTWATAITIYSPINDLDVMRADLDGDGSPEIIIPRLDGEANGLGIRYFSLYILRDPLTAGFHEPLRIQTQEFGNRGGLIYNPQTKAFDILISYWTGLNLTGIVPNVKKGGTYFVGRWFHYHDGKLIPDLEKPILARRYLDRFVQERYQKNTASRQFAPYSWLQGKSTQSLKDDPEIPAEASLSLKRGTILKYESHELKTPDTNGETQNSVYETYTVKFDDGQTVEYMYDSPDEINEQIKDLKQPKIQQFGFLPARRILPDTIHVLNVFGSAKSLAGKRVTVTTYPAENEVLLQTILWFDEK